MKAKSGYAIATKQVHDKIEDLERSKKQLEMKLNLFEEQNQELKSSLALVED